MATRVNTRFVIILSVSLVVLFGGVVVAGVVALSGRHERNVAKADALMGQGAYEEAARLYERAVGHDRTRQDWLEKWITAIRQSSPEVATEYQQWYDFYRNSLRQLAVLRRTDPEAQIRYIDELDRFVRETGGSREGYEYLAREAGERARDLDPDHPDTRRLLRYRGLAVTDQMSLLTVDEEKRAQALEDLKNAVEADPSDWRSKLGLVRWHIAEADRWTRDGRTNDAAASSAEAKRLLAEFLEANSGHPEGLLMDFLLAQGEFNRRKPGPEEARRANAELLEKALNVLTSAVTTPVEEMRPSHVQRLVAVLSKGLPPAEAAVLEEVLDKVIAANPDDVGLAVSKGSLLLDRGLLQESIDYLQKVVDQPRRPVSIEGLVLPNQRIAALALQMDAALRLWAEAEQEKDQAKARQWLARTKEYRNRLADIAGVRARPVLLVRDAKLALAESRFAEAVQLLSEARSIMEDSPIEVTQLLAQALEHQGSFGEARRLYYELVERAPNMAWAQAKAGQMCVRLGEIERALPFLRTALQLEPENDDYKRQIAAIQEALSAKASMTGGTTAAAAPPAEGQGDPVIRAILQARTLRVDQKYDEALQTLQAALVEHPSDARLIRETVQTLLRMNRRSEAVALLEAKHAEFPNARMIEEMLIFARIEDPVEAQLKIIAESDLSDADKAIERFELFSRVDRTDDAAAALAEAERLAPHDPRVIDYSFVIALGKGDKARYEALARIAAEKNIDQMNGLLYQARIEMVEGRHRDAVLTLERAVARNEFLPQVRRLLAQAYLQVGRTQDALDQYQRAYEGKPDDPATARDYAQALVAANRGPDALAVMSPETGILRHVQTNEDLVRIWLDLESAYGNRETALRIREQRFRANPDNLENAIALFNLLLQEQQWDRSQEVLTAIEGASQANELTVAALKANRFARMGRVNDGRDALRAHVDSIPEAKRTATPYLTLGEFLVQHNRREEAVAVFEEGRKYQDPKLLEIDRRMGDFVFDMGAVLQSTAELEHIAPEGRLGLESETTYTEAAHENYREALKYYKNVLAAKHDDLVAKRAAETAVRLELPDEAERILEPVAKVAPDDLQVLTLRANIARLRKNDRLTRQLLDRAVELYPNDAHAFLQRAQFNANEISLLPDALADFRQAERLRPTLAAAWVAHAMTLKKHGRLDEAVEVLRGAAAASPENDRLRVMIVQELLVSGKPDLAQAEVLKTAAERPDSPAWLKEAAGFMERFGRFKEAGDLYEKAYALEPSPELAGRVLVARLNGSTEFRAEASTINKYAQEFEKIDLNDAPKEQAIPTLLLRARARAFLKQTDRAKSELDRAMVLVGEDPVAARFFSDGIIPSLGSAQAAVEYLQERHRQSPLPLYLRVTLLRGRQLTGANPETLLKDAREIATAATNSDNATKFEVYRLIGELAYRVTRYEEAAEAYHKALEIAPNSVQINNDLAYALAVDLNRPSDALPYAQKAAELAPDASQVLDTLGWVYYLLGDYDRAVESLDRAAATAVRPDQKLIAFTHLGLAQVKAGNRMGARDALDAAERAGRDNPGALEAFKQDVESLRKALE